MSTVQSAPWSHDKVGFSQATHTGKGVHIYVMDTGVRTTHSEFTGRAIRTFDYSSEGACTDGDTECAADNGGHGTLCAATAGGKQYGVATDAIIHAMKVCGNDGSCDIQKGLDWLVLNAEEPAVMTMSLGIEDKSETGKAAIDQIVDSGVTVFVSAGNSNLDSCTASWSWGFVSSTIAVGSVDEANKRSPWSNWGECNAIYAPGSNILSAHSASDSSSWTVSGTDMAAPLVAGSAALLLEANPSWAPAEIRSKLIDSAKKASSA